MRKRYPAIFLGIILSFGVLTGCGMSRTVQQPQQMDSGSSEREAELQAEVDALQQELDAMKEAQSQEAADAAQTADNADDAQTGDNSTTQSDNTQDQNTGNTGSNTNSGGASDLAISMEEAQNIALERVPGATAQDMSIELDYDDGWYIYEGDILYNRTEYEFEIDANTGNILKWEEERW